MSHLIHMQNKVTGVTYVYESTSYWDAEKKQPRNKRRCIGKLDPETGALIPSKRSKAEEVVVRDPAITATVLNIGVSLLLNPILESTGLENVLRKSLKKSSAEILSLAYYLVAEAAPYPTARRSQKATFTPQGKY